MLLLRLRLLPLLRAGAGAAHLPTSASASRPSASAPSSSSLYLSRLLLSTAATPTPFSVGDYLVASCGLTGAQARNVSAKVSHLKSASNPDAVLALLSGVGLSRADLAAVVAAEPRILCARADNIARRLHSLRDRVGLSDAQIARLLLAGSAKSATGIRMCDITTRLEFWIPFVGSFEMLLKMVKANYAILTADVEKVIKPNVALLQECGLTVCDIVKMAHLSRMLLTTNPKQLEMSVKRADEIGVQRSSGLFKYMLAINCRCTEHKATARMRFLGSTLCCSMDKIHDIVCKYPSILVYSEENLRSKMEFLASTLGCSQDKICAAVCKKPPILGLSDDNLRRKINFMVTEAGLEPKDIIERPLLLTFSLEKRIVPRHSVIKILRAMGLMKDAVDFKSLLAYPERNFIARYVDPYKQAAPTIAGSYAAACAGKLSAEVHL